MIKRPGSTKEKEQFWRDMHAPLMQSYRIVTGVAIVVLLIFSIEDWFSFPNDLTFVYSMKLIMIGSMLGIFQLTRTRWGQRYVEVYGPVGFFIVLITAVYQSTIIHDSISAIFGAMFATVALATMMPARIRSQVIYVTGSILAILTNAFLLQGTPYQFPGHEVVGGITFSAASILLALYSNDRRFALWKAERALNEQHEFLQTVLDSLTHPFYVINVADYTVEIANQAAYAEGLPGKMTCHHLIHGSDEPCDSAHCPCPLDEHKHTKKPVIVEHIHTGENGQEIHYEVHGFPILDQDGQVVQMIEYALDITERMEIEGQKQQLAAAEERERIGRELHDDLGQVMGYIHMQVEAALARLKQTDTENTTQILKDIDQVALEAHDSVRQYILGIRTGKMEPQHIGFLDAVQSYLETISNRYGLAIELTAAPDMQERLRLEPSVETQTLRVIQEGITNIYKHAHADLVQLILSLDGDWLQVLLKDNGGGFTVNAGVQAEVGEHFGLKIMQERVESVNGQFEITTAPGEGTQLQFHVPRLLSRSNEGDVQGYPWRVLLVDDHALFLEGLGNMLRPHGIQIVGAAKNGVEAESLAEELHPDLILMDIHMPERDGLETTRIIKQRFPQIKIVMLTMADDEKLLLEALRNGASGYLLKSLPAPQFLSLLSDVMDGKTIVSPILATQVLTALAQGDQDLLSEMQDERGDHGLTDRQQEVLRCIAQGMNNKQIAAELYISENTVKYHVRQIMDRLGLKTRHELIRYQIESDS